jgi:NAD(P)-dependent dehydrogenase (short-subunit alcohol dehydrogenase family)
MMTTVGTEVGAWLGLTARVCVVTGAGSGIGAETARQLASAGALVATLDRDAKSAATVAADIERVGGRAIGLMADVSDMSSVQAAAVRIKAELGPCQILVNNAAARHRAPLTDISMEAWNHVLAVNLTGPLICTQAFVPQMIAAGAGGSIVHVGSVLGHHPQFDAGAYCASKAGLGMLARALALELGPHRIRSNVVSPGFTRTPANEASYRDPESAAARSRLIPAGRVAVPADLAQVIAFLVSDRANYINGQDILVDGGLSRTLMSRVPRPGHGAGN